MSALRKQSIFCSDPHKHLHLIIPNRADQSEMAGPEGRPAGRREEPNDARSCGVPFWIRCHSIAMDKLMHVWRRHGVTPGMLQ
jgi:hypothetical protein